MSNNRFNFLIMISILWIAGIFSLYIFGLFERPSSFNELGDFLAGIFAPVAFVWLIFGYIQQGKQLEQNSIAINQQAKALKQQTEVLNLQIKEMKESVEQQKELVDQQRKQNVRKLLEVKPNIRFHQIMNAELTKYFSLDNLDEIPIGIDLNNVGSGSAQNVKIYSRIKGGDVILRDERVKIDKGDHKKLNFSFLPDEIKTLKIKRICEIRFNCTYECILGEKYNQHFTLVIQVQIDSITEINYIKAKIKI